MQVRNGKGLLKGAESKLQAGEMSSHLDAKMTFLCEIHSVFPSRGSSYASIVCFCLSDFPG